jgi:DNA-binding NtrC family response regulator
MERIVLLVDDDTSLTAALQRRLRNEPYRTIIAGSGDEALLILEGRPVDVLVSDEHMPGMSGVELVSEVRRRRPAVVSVMLSGQASAGTVIRALNQGQIFRFLLKPCDVEELATVVRHALAHKAVLDRCRELLPMHRLMVQALSEIERRQPGIVGSLGGPAPVPAAVVVGKEDFYDLDELAERLAVEIDRTAALVPKFNGAAPA